MLKDLFSKFLLLLGTYQRTYYCDLTTSFLLPLRDYPFTPTSSLKELKRILQPSTTNLKCLTKVLSCQEKLFV